MSALYPREHPYSWPVIGSMEDLTAASLEDVSAFFRTYYAPNNASLVLAGDFDPVRARALVEKHFGAIARGAAVKRPQPAPPRLDREIREEMEDSVQLPRIYMAWHSTPRFSKAEAAVDMLSMILGGGKSSRLYKALQFDRQIVQDTFAGNPASELAGLFLMIATAKPGQTLGEIQRVIDEEITKLKTTPATAEEIERAYVEYESQFIFGLQTVLGKAEQLNSYATFLDDPGYLGKDLARYRSITAADVQQAAREYLTDKRVVLSVLPRRTPPAGHDSRPEAGGVRRRRDGSTSECASRRSRGEGRASVPDGPGQDHGFVPAAEGGPDPKLTLPAVQRRRLSNGLDVLVVEHHELPVVNLNLVVKTGGASNPDAKGGLAQITADMLDEGTPSRSSAAIADQLSGIGASLSLTAGWDSTTASMRALTRHLDAALDLYADVITNPAFPEQELARLPTRASPH